MGLIARKLVFGVSSQVRLKPTCSAIKISQNFCVLQVVYFFRMCRNWSDWAGWSAPVLFVCNMVRFSRVRAHTAPYLLTVSAGKLEQSNHSAIKPLLFFSQSINNPLPTRSICMIFRLLLIFFSKSIFSKKKFRNTIGISNSLILIRPDIIWAWSGSKLFANVISKWH